MNPGDHPRFPESDPVLAGLEPGFLVGGGRYTLRRVLGSGPASVVWLAADAQLSEDLALKFYRSELSNDTAFAGHLRREAQRSRRLSHPHIIHIHDVFHSPGELLFIAMEFVEGMDLGQFQKEQADEVFPWELCQPLAEQLCSALQYAHAEGLVHGNLKPANLIRDPRARWRIADFGLPALPPELMQKIAGEDFHPDALPFLSPQRLDGAPPTPHDDIYAAGAILYRALTGRPPFCTGDIHHQIRNLRPQTLSERLNETGIHNPVPAPVAAAVLACLAKDPEQRPLDAAALLDQIHAPPPPEPELPDASTQSPPLPPGNEHEPISLMPPEEENLPHSPPPSTEPQFTDPWKGETEEPEERFSLRDWIAAHSLAVLVVLGLALVMLGYYLGVKQQEMRAARDAQQDPEWIRKQIALDQARRERLQKTGLIMVGTGPRFDYQYQPREARALDTNALNTNVRFWDETGSGDCCFLGPGGATNDARGFITYEFETEPGYLIDTMRLFQSSAIYTRGSVQGEYSTDSGNTYTSFYSTPPFQRGAHAGHAETAQLTSLRATNLLVRYTLYRFEGEEYNIQFLRDCQDSPASLEITATIIPAAP